MKVPFFVMRYSVAILSRNDSSSAVSFWFWEERMLLVSFNSVEYKIKKGMALPYPAPANRRDLVGQRILSIAVSSTKKHSFKV